MRRGLVVLAFVGVMLGLSPLASATHFRFGHVTWKRIDPANPNKVEFTIRQAYRWDYPVAITQPFLFGDGQAANLVVSTQVKPPVGGPVIAVNVAENYFISEVKVTHTYATAGTFTASFSNCCRLSTLRNSNDTQYDLRTRVDLTSATAGSAVSSVPPVLRVPKNTPGGFTYQLPVVHPAGETVTCSLTPLAESGIRSQPGLPSGTYLDPYLNPTSPWLGVNSACQLKWNPTSSLVPAGLYAVQIKLSNAASSAPLDFVIELVPGTDAAPTCTGPTGSQTVIAGQTYTASLVGADPDGDQLRITHQGLPPGATLTPPANSTGASPLSAQFSWTPSVADVGLVNAVTITFTDPLGLQGNCGFAFTVLHPDTDGDGVTDNIDNCPTVPNPAQDDFDGDDVGDACDPDIDDDSIVNGSDNCQLVPNPDQSDVDHDGQGDLCDGDDDGDLVLDGDDNCVAVANADQLDTDGDGQGDACDADDDNDGVGDAGDNCALVANADQHDLDGDGQGDACDSDVDGDGVPNSADNCSVISNPSQADNDGDGAGDACDADDDNDGVADSADNCVLVANAGQSDIDSDGAGDVCDPDIDGDTVLNETDNCPVDANTDQADLDGSGGGDVCDPDDDADGIADVADNCAREANADQANLDGDALGDVCDDDLDGDGVKNTTDNCVSAPNADQADADADGAGDLCDSDLDGDGVPNASDNCERVANADQADLDGDGAGNACDPDADDDGVPNESDNCALAANPTQADLDGDGTGDVCDSDLDGDGVANATDNCVAIANADQADLDGDGQGNVCDADRDGDGVPNTTDNCADIANATQSDLDGDGLGDACDGDSDGDGVLNPADQCPLEPALADADGNGCRDTAALLCGVVQGANLHQGITNSLCAKANNAAASSGATAANILDAFIHEVSAQRGKKIALAIADMLIEYATNAKANL